jgi:hypothetical protein
VASRTQRVLAHSALALLATTIAAGCGEDTTDGFASLGEREMERIVVRDMKRLESLHLAGASSPGKDKVALDLVLTSRGDCSGTMSLNRGELAYRRVDGVAYVKGDRAYWTASVGSSQAAAQVMTVVGDKWARLPPAQDGFGTFCDIDDFMDEFRTDRTATGADEEVTTVGEVSEVEGVDAVEVVTKRGQETTVTWVSVDSPHLVLRVESAGGEQPGTFRLDGFDDAVEVTAPPADEVVDLRGR